jgi:TfoX/Sxy family transcriptional regulator of competence genes
MPYNLVLEERMEKLMPQGAGFEKKKMFGGIGCLFHGNMGFGIYRDFLVLRLDEKNAGLLRKEKYARPFDITGRPMKGWVMVSEEGWRDPKQLKEWLRLAREYAVGLPAKP